MAQLKEGTTIGGKLAETVEGAQAKADAAAGAALSAAKAYADEAVAAHAGRTDNPHGVTKSQVGLGNVENYGIATQAEAQAGSVNNKYMTPLRVKQAVDASGTSAATANTLVRRDNAGRASVADPTSASHIATKGYVDSNFAPIYPTIYEVDFDGTIEIEAGGFIQREVVIPSSLGNVRFGVIHTLPPVGLGFTVFNNIDITVGRRQIGTTGSTLALVVRLWNRSSDNLSFFTGSFKIYLMLIPFP